MKSRYAAANDWQSLARYFAITVALFLVSASFAWPQSGDIYVSVTRDGTVRRITSDGNVSVFAAGFTHPSGLVFGRDGNLYVADWTADAIKRVSPSGQVTRFVQISKPYGLATDEAGNFYASHLSASNPLNNAVSRITTNGSITVFATGFNSPAGIVVDPVGNMYVANRGSNSVIRVPVSGPATVFATNLSLPTGSPWMVQAGSLSPTGATIPFTASIRTAGHRSFLPLG